MKRSLKRILSTGMAAAMMICSISAEAPLKLLNPPDVVHADGYVTFSEKEGVLSLYGTFTKEQLWGYRDNDKVTSVVAKEDAILPKDCSSLFQSDNISYENYWPSLQTVDLSNTDASQVTTMDKMFSNCPQLKKVNLSNLLNSSNLLTADSMFFGCDQLIEVDLTGFNTVNLQSMSTMFKYCKSLKELNLSSFNTAKVTNMSGMFAECEELETLDLSNFDTTNCWYQQGLFENCSHLKTIYVSNMWYTLELNSFETVFDNCVSLVGEKGTAYNKNNIGYKYACIDNPPLHPGYFTYKYHYFDNVRVEFDKNGGRGHMSPASVERGSQYALPVCKYTPPSEELSFCGWKVNNKIMQPKEIIAPQTNMIVTAQWQTTICKIQFDPNGGSGDMAPESIKKGTEYTLPECTFTPPGSDMAFCGWKIGTKVMQPGEIITADKDMTISAQWERVVFNVSFHSNGGHGNMKTESVKKGTAFTIPDCTFTPPSIGLKFIAWMIDDTSYQPGDTIVISDDTILTAQWQEYSGICGDSLTWIFDFESKTLSINGNGEMYNFEKMKIDPPWKELGDKIKKLSLPTGLTAIYQKAFAGLDCITSVTIPASVNFVGADSFICRELKDVYIMNANTSIQPSEATFCNTVKISKDENGNSIVQCDFTGTIHGYSGSSAQRYAKQFNRKFIEIPIEPDETSGKCGESLTWEFNKNSGTLVIEGSGDMDDYEYTWTPWSSFVKSITEIHLPEGISYIGNYAFAECAVSVVEIPDSVTGMGRCVFDECTQLKEVNIPAKMNVIPNGTFTRSGLSSFVIPNRIAAVQDGAFQECSNLKDIYIYNPKIDIWDSSDTLGIPQKTIIHGFADSTAQYYAEMNGYQFEIIDLCISFEPGTGSGEMKPMTAAYGLEFTLPECTFTAPKHYMVFTGWELDGEIKQPGDKITVVSDITLHALWSLKFCNVTFDANGGTGEMGAKQVLYGSEFTFPKCTFTAPEDAAFSHWTMGDAVYEIGDTIMLEEDAVIKAWWYNPDGSKSGGRRSRGNLNGDSKINTEDAMLLARYVSDWKDIEIDPDAADIDRDGTISVRDAMILARYVNGWEGYDTYFIDDRN